MDTLDLAVAQAVAAARLLERALHQADGWEMEYSGQRFPVTRRVCSQSIHLVGEMPAQCWVSEPDGWLSLLVDGDLVARRPIPHPGDGGHQFDWTLTPILDVMSA